ncbi:Uncharacterised protein [Mycobacteroides abscessus subsp. abscessus]|nr:Uncharacterised protein [Mycobacteroides abscessus subsp. abscessus]
MDRSRSRPTASTRAVSVTSPLRGARSSTALTASVTRRPAPMCLSPRGVPSRTDPSWGAVSILPYSRKRAAAEARTVCPALACRYPSAAPTKVIIAIPAAPGIATAAISDVLVRRR